MTQAEFYTEQLIETIKNFTNAPYLFIGSGLSRRYLNTPNWENLLKHFASIIKKDEFAYDSYKSLANNNKPKIGELISKDYDNLWFNENEFRETQPQEIKDLIRNLKCTPFRAAVSLYLKSFKELEPSHIEEIELFKELSKKSISAIITTNYDELLENLTSYTTYVGQTELLAASPTGFGEIYKIHGTLNDPNSIVLTMEDYQEFDKRAQYLSAKLITFFIENPIFFIGYSLSDININNIIDTIINCFPKSETKLLEQFAHKLFFVEFNEKTELEISKYEYSTNFAFTKIITNDFKKLYSLLSEHKQKIPINIIRKLKAEFCQFTETNVPTETIQVLNIDDERLEDTDYAIYIGSQNSIIGLVGVSRDDVFIDIILDNLKYTPDAILSKAFPSFLNNKTKTPCCKYIVCAKKIIPEDISIPNTFEDLIPATIKNKKHNYQELNKNKTINWIFEKDEDSVFKKLNYLHFLSKETILKDLDLLQLNLLNILEEYPNAFQPINKGGLSSSDKSYLRKAIRIYDYLKYGEKAQEIINKQKES